MNDSKLNYRQQLETYQGSDHCHPLLICADALSVLESFPDNCIDFCMTSPPYWNKRAYQNGGIGLEPNVDQYIEHLLQVFEQVKRVLKNTGSFWLNMGDTYQRKRLLGIPWRIALVLTDQQKWILRNDIVWNKLKGPDNTPDKLRNTHEFIFHFVKEPHGFYYDVLAIRSQPRKAQIRNGAVVSATGVTGVRYKRQLELSTALSEAEKQTAFGALEAMLQKVRQGEIADFRMVIRNQQRTTHSDSQKISGRAKELAQRGFYFLQYHPNGSKPGDVWDILPEDTAQRGNHYAAYPEDVCKLPILATCPANGLALDPFCGTGTTNLVCFNLGRKSIGVDLSREYIAYAQERCQRLL